MEERKNDEKIMFMLGEISGDVKGVCGRLDTLNSKVAKHEERLNDNEIKKAEIRGGTKVVSWFWTTSTGVLGGAVALALAKLSGF